MAYINSSNLNGKSFEPSTMKEVNINEEKLYYVRSTDGYMEYIAKVKCTPVFIKERVVGSQLWKNIEQNGNTEEIPIEEPYIPVGLQNTYEAQMASPYRFYEMEEERVNIGGKRHRKQRKTAHKIAKKSKKTIRKSRR